MLSRKERGGLRVVYLLSSPASTRGALPNKGNWLPLVMAWFFKWNFLSIFSPDSKRRIFSRLLTNFHSETSCRLGVSGPLKLVWSINVHQVGPKVDKFGLGTTDILVILNGHFKTLTSISRILSSWMQVCDTFYPGFQLILSELKHYYEKYFDV